jgi:hypothetical protein
VAEAVGDLRSEAEDAAALDARLEAGTPAASAISSPSRSRPSSLTGSRPGCETRP